MIESKLLIAFALGFIACGALLIWAARMVGELNAVETHEKRLV